MSMYMRSRISQRHRLTVRITHSSGLLHTPLLLPPFSLIVVMLFIIIFNSILISHHSNCMYVCVCGRNVRESRFASLKRIKISKQQEERMPKIVSTAFCVYSIVYGLFFWR